MSGYWLNIALVVVLILVNAVFAGSEMALVSLREGQLRSLEKEGGARAMKLVELARDPNRFLATIQIGITLAGFLASATAAVSLAEPIVPLLDFLGSAANPVAVGVVTIIISYFTLVFGELAPKRLAMQMALPWALLVVRPLGVLSTLSRPAVAMLSASTNAIVRLLGGKPEAEVEEVSQEELRDMVTSHRGLNDEQREIISGALEIHERMLREVLVPRGTVFALDAAMTVAQARTAMVEAGHSRAPVTRGDLDETVGVVHWSALLDHEGGDNGGLPVTAVAAPPMVVPDTLRITAALRQFKAERQQLALVVDEHGSIDGIVTLEDLLEEVVGEIYDETDSDSVGVTPDADGTWSLPGTYPVHDLVDLDIPIAPSPAADYTTVAGLVLKHLGRIPTTPGDVVEVDGWSIEVTDVQRRAITRVRMTLLPEPVVGEGEESVASSSRA